MELSVPSGVQEIVRRYYSNVVIRWNGKEQAYELCEKTVRGAVPWLRRICIYVNEDGTKYPLVADRAVELLKRADIRLWPVEDRMALFDKEDAKREEKIGKEAAERLGTRIVEDYHYIAGIPTFFFGEHMEVPRATRTPWQERLHKQQQC